MNRSIRYLIPLALMVAAAGAGCAVAQNAPPAAPAGAAARPAAPAVPAAPTIVGIARVTFKASDIEKSRFYYNKVLGLPVAWETKDAAGKVTSIHFKVNDEQFVEIVSGLKPGEIDRLGGVAIQSSNLPALREDYIARGLNPSAISTGADGNPTFRVVLPNGRAMEFLQYAPTSKEGQLRGKLLTPDRISTHLLHAGIHTTDDASRAFFPKLGLQRPMGDRGDYLEWPTADRNLLTKNPPLDPANPATKAQYDREVSGSSNHFSLEMEDVWQTRETVKARGGFDDVRMRTAVGGSRRWLIHVFDPDGTRTEFMSKEVVPDAIPSNSVMPPGPKAPPILSTPGGGYPWP